MRKIVTVDELRYLIQHWDSLTVSQLSEDMTKLFGFEITRSRINNMVSNLRKRGCNLAKKPKERDSAYNLAARFKPNVYDMAASEKPKVLEIKHI